MFTRWMDLEADPCEDFSQFMCGKMYEKRIEPGDIQDTPISFGVAWNKRKSQISTGIIIYPRVEMNDKEDTHNWHKDDEAGDYKVDS